MLTHKNDSEILQYALEYFEKYCKIETTSDPESSETPSSPKIWDLAKVLQADLKELGIEAACDEHAYVYASLPANTPAQHTLGLIAHMDTSPDASGHNVRPFRVTYQGKPLLLQAEGPKELEANPDPTTKADHPDHGEEAVILSPDQFPALNALEGTDIIVTDGRTLLGADDKAGVAEIMALLKYLLRHPEVKHGEIKVAFTPDEEIGQGTKFFDIKRFGADVAYTVDGGPLGELNWENFNAAAATVHIQGLNVHPGSAKDKMVNSLLLATDYIKQLPAMETPAHTDNYEGFYHLCDVVGTVEETTLSYIIRDFDADIFALRKQLMQNVAQAMNEDLGSDRITVEITDQYANMKEKILPYRFLIDHATAAMEEVGVPVQIVPCRGGTDGAMLSFKGLPCPNLFTGGANYHSRLEYLSVPAMEKACEVLLHLVPKFI